MMSHISWEGEQTTVYKGVSFKALRPERESPKSTISTSGDLGRYKMFIEFHMNK